MLNWKWATSPTLFCKPAELSSIIELINISLGTFYNAIPGANNKSKVKQWAWEAYPAAYEDLLKCDLGTIVRVNAEGEEENDSKSKDVLFDIGPLGRDVEA